MEANWCYLGSPVLEIGVEVLPSNGRRFEAVN